MLPPQAGWEAGLWWSALRGGSHILAERVFIILLGAHQWCSAAEIHHQSRLQAILPAAVYVPSEGSSASLTRGNLPLATQTCARGESPRCVPGGWQAEQLLFFQA